MTVNYNYQIATSKPLVIFRLLWRWRGSVWKAVLVEYLVWIGLYAIISLIYRFALTREEQDIFETFAQFCDKKMSYIPMNFMLSFFVTIIVNRWVTVFSNLGMIDNIALFTSTHVKGQDERGRNLRRNIVRYCVLAQSMVFRDISIQVRKRFPTMDTLVSSGFMMEHEKEKFESIKNRYAKYWVPFNWALSLLNRAKEEGRVDSDITLNAVAQEIRTFRTGLSLIWTYDWVPIPMMYPQLVFLAVHVYFMVCLISRQFIIGVDATNRSPVDLYFPFMSSIEFIFFMGWTKVAMALLNPFGEDDDDFECNFLLDRNLTVSLGCVDDGFDDPPEVMQDVFWEDTVQPLYSQESTGRSVNFYFGSATRQELPESVKEIKMMPHPVNEHYDSHYIPHGARRRRRTSVVSVVNRGSETPRMMEKKEKAHSRTRTSTILSNIQRRASTISTSIANLGHHNHKYEQEKEKEKEKEEEEEDRERGDSDAYYRSSRANSTSTAREEKWKEEKEERARKDSLYYGNRTKRADSKYGVYGEEEGRDADRLPPNLARHRASTDAEAWKPRTDTGMFTYDNPVVSIQDEEGAYVSDEEEERKRNRLSVSTMHMPGHGILKHHGGGNVRQNVERSRSFSHREERQTKKRGSRYDSDDE